MKAAPPRLTWPEGKSFAFTIFDDPDAQVLKDGREVYSLLADLGFRTTKGVWPSGPLRQRNSKGDTCADRSTATMPFAFRNAGSKSAITTMPPILRRAKRSSRGWTRFGDTSDGIR